MRCFHARDYSNVDSDCGGSNCYDMSILSALDLDSDEIDFGFVDDENDLFVIYYRSIKIAVNM